MAKKMVTTDQGTLEERMQNNHLSTQTFKAFNQVDIDTDLPTAYKNLFTKFDEQERKGSGWVLDKILQIEIHTDYPAEIHDQPNDYLMAPERRTVQINDLSEYSQKLRKHLGMKGKPNEKLIPNLDKKKKYVVHYRNLQ